MGNGSKKKVKNVISYIEGDLFAAIKDKKNTIVLPHICNSKKAWGAGFVVPLGKHYPKAKEVYLSGSPQLGDTDFVECDNVIICNMVAQTLGGERPLYYQYLAKCMEAVANRCFSIECYDAEYEIHAPAFGTNLAGGDFNIIKELIHDCWIRDLNAKVNIYYLPGTFLPPT